MSARSVHVDAAATVERGEEVLTPDALAFVAELDRRFHDRRDELLLRRRERREAAARSGRLDFLPETAEVRSSEWSVAPLPADLLDRRVEITGPTDRKMAINALNSGAQVWLADLEDANTPHWRNVVGGQVTLRDAVRRTISYTSPEGKSYRLSGGPLPVVVPRPRGWHLSERHVVVDGRPAVGALVDAGLYAFHNATELLGRGSAPYFYLPKLESHLEARLWDEVLTTTEQHLGLRHGTIRATVLVETIPAAFEMEEILFELRDHAAGLNAGRWDYLFSLIKTFRDAGADFVLPDRGSITMTAPFMRAYTELLVSTCHRRGAMAIGGMAAFIPSRKDAEVNARALQQVRADKEREARDGFDGSWVAHPDLVPLCREVFDAALGDRSNQLHRRRDDVAVSSGQLLDVTTAGGEVTEAGVRTNVEVALRYVEAWLGGNGAVAIHGLMEDAATAEICRSQLWQWVRHGTRTREGDVVTADYVRRVLDEEHAALRSSVAAGAPAAGRLDEARQVVEQVTLAEEYVDFLTLAAYDRLADDV